MRRLLERRVLFFGGKGGVGKTTVSAAYAILSADEGARTLLVSTDPAHSLADVLEVRLGGEPREVLPSLFAMEIDPERETERHIEEVKERIEQVTSPRLLAEVEREIDVARVSPGAEEAALFERFAALMQEAIGSPAVYDRVIFDTAPTGHTLRLLSLPELMTVWITGLAGRRRRLGALGRMWRNVAGSSTSAADAQADPVLASLERRQAKFVAARAIVTDPTLAAFVFVLIPERLPILETRKALDALSKHGIPIGGLVVNQVLPEEAESAFLARRRGRERDHLAEIERTFSGWPILRLPLFDSDVHGIAALRRVIAALPERERSRG